ncbi:MFS transporter [Streptomyces pristinaespiralis]|uniref:MFS transporter n=1 Tax=Streptomyces pristinaespiralis TaxID=38300 RepID=UPI003838F88B
MTAQLSDQPVPAAPAGPRPTPSAPGHTTASASGRTAVSGSGAGVRVGKTRRAAGALAVIAGCNAMIQLDDPIVNIALPGMRADLGLSAVGASWVVTAYLLAFGGLLLLGGRLGDLLGRRRVFMAGVALFTAAAALRGAASSGEMLIAVRAVQGVGAALAAPSGLALLLSMFPPGPARTRAIAVCTAAGALSTAGGLLLAGALTSLGSWRWVVYLDVPVGVAIVVAAPFVLVETRRVPGRLDAAGALLSALGAAALVFGLARAAERPWSDLGVAGGVPAGIAVLVLFAVVERRARQPLVAPALFADRDRLLAYGATLAVPGAVIGTYFFLNQFFQAGRGWSALVAACALLPLPVTTALAAAGGERLLRRLGARRMLAVGAGLLMCGNGWLALSVTGPYPVVLPALVLLGAGMACGVLPLTVLATSSPAPDGAGAASGVLNAVQSVGGSVGLATLVAVASHGGGAAAGFVAGAGFAALTLVAAAGLRRRPAAVVS